jgi:hypothetical protein
MEEKQESIEKSLSQRGIYLCSRQEPRFFMDLYQLDNYWVEVVYHQKQKQQLCIKVFSDPALLQPYVQGVDLSGLR